MDKYKITEGIDGLWHFFFDKKYNFSLCGTPADTQAKKYGYNVTAERTYCKECERLLFNKFIKHLQK